MANPKEACILLHFNQGLDIFVNTEIIMRQDGIEQNRSWDLKILMFFPNRNVTADEGWRGGPEQLKEGL